METAVFEVENKNGTIYRIFCANKTQKLKFLRSYNALKNLGIEIDLRDVSKGIHTVKQWQEIMEYQHEINLKKL